jgi:hypothetical protein
VVEETDCAPDAAGMSVIPVLSLALEPPQAKPVDLVI